MLAGRPTGPGDGIVKDCCPSILLLPQESAATMEMRISLVAVSRLSSNLSNRTEFCEKTSKPDPATTLRISEKLSRKKTK